MSFYCDVFFWDVLGPELVLSPIQPQAASPQGLQAAPSPLQHQAVLWRKIHRFLCGNVRGMVEDTVPTHTRTPPARPMPTFSSMGRRLIQAPTSPAAGFRLKVELLESRFGCEMQQQSKVLGLQREVSEQGVLGVPWCRRAG